MNYKLKLMDLKFGKNTKLGARWVNVGIKNVNVCQGCYFFNSYLERYMLNLHSVRSTDSHKHEFADDFHIISYLKNKAYDYITKKISISYNNGSRIATKEVFDLPELKRDKLSKVVTLIFTGLLGQNKEYDITDKGLDIDCLNIPLTHYVNLAMKCSVPTYVELKKGVNPFMMYNTEWFELMNAMFDELYGTPELPVKMSDYTHLLFDCNTKFTCDEYKIIDIDAKVAEVRYKETHYSMEKEDHDKYNEYDRWHNKALDVSQYRAKNIPLMNYDLAMGYAFSIINEEGIESEHPIFEALPFFKSALLIPKSDPTAEMLAINYEDVCKKFDLYNWGIQSVWELVKIEDRYELLNSSYEPEYTLVKDKWLYNYESELEKSLIEHKNRDIKLRLFGPK